VQTFESFWKIIRFVSPGVKYSGALHLYRVLSGFSTNIRAPKGAFLSFAFFSSRIPACFFIIRKAKVQRTDDIGSYHTTNNEAEVQRTGIFLCLFEVI
jgi:hypothetical protein